MFFLIRPVGFTCNASCKYCYYKFGHLQMREKKIKHMKIETMQRIISQINKLQDKQYTFCLHGGEPLLTNKQWVLNLIELIADFNNKNSEKEISLALQTNGLLIDKTWIDIFKRGKIGVSISLDGPEEVNDKVRVIKNGSGTFKIIINSIKMLQDEGFKVSIISVLTKAILSTTPEKYYNFFRELGIFEMDITSYIETGDSGIEQNAKKYELSKEEMLEFYKLLFNIWFYEKETKLNIRTFEQTVLALLGYIPSLCNRKEGLACGKTPCIMPNGDVFACDLETNNINLKLGNVHKNSITNIFGKEKINSFHSYLLNTFEAKGCTTCSLFGYCGFACPRYSLNNYHNPDLCYFSKHFIEYVKNTINNVSSNLFNENITFSL